ncbi:unnamed protein product, partial [Rhizoctonia solani]
AMHFPLNTLTVEEGGSGSSSARAPPSFCPRLEIEVVRPDAGPWSDIAAPSWKADPRKLLSRDTIDELPAPNWPTRFRGLRGCSEGFGGMGLALTLSSSSSVAESSPKSCGFGEENAAVVSFGATFLTLAFSKTSLVVFFVAAAPTFDAGTYTFLGFLEELRRIICSRSAGGSGRSPVSEYAKSSSGTRACETAHIRSHTSQTTAICGSSDCSARRLVFVRLTHSIFWLTALSASSGPINKWVTSLDM